MNVYIKELCIIYDIQNIVYAEDCVVLENSIGS